MNERDEQSSPEKPTEKTILVGSYSASQLDPSGMAFPLKKQFDQLYGSGEWELKMRVEDVAEGAIRVEMGTVARTAANLEWAGFGHVDHDGNPVPESFTNQPKFDPMYDLYVTPDAAERAKE